MRVRSWKSYGLGAGGMLVVVVAILLATGWGTAVAAQMTSVFVTNDGSHAVPVREQALDANGNVKVHEQGTAAVHEQGTASVTTAPASKHDRVIALGDNTPTAIGPLNASLIIVRMRSDAHVFAVRFLGPGGMVFDLPGAADGAPADAVFPLNQPIPVSQVELSCTDSTNCEADVQVVGS